MNRQCLKCNHLKLDATGDELEACPACGAIYSRVEAAWADKSTRAPVQVQAPKQAGRLDALDIAAFADVLRADSLYPTFRALVKLGYWAWILVAAVVFIGAWVVLFRGPGEPGAGRIGAFVIGLGMSALIYIMGRLIREMSLMLADLSDASVRTAATLSQRD